MDSATRAHVWTRADGRCEYCRIHQDHVELSHHIEHIVARKHGGRAFAESEGPGRGSTFTLLLPKVSAA